MARWVRGAVTWRRRETGSQAMKFASERKVLKKTGQLAWVKLLPRLESKGRGSVVVMGVAVATRLVAEGVVVMVVTPA